ncbi:PBECR4 domain-containing protein [Fusobacterium animalis]|uniref:PBECR4 domain-containing protein n=2 Tax=Fusobacterium animalis TaxID=76859 RepID=UPI0030CEB294
MDSGKIFKKLRLAQKVYDENFLNKEFLYIYENKNEIKKFSITFKKQNFLHLTGIKYNSKDNMNPLDFYRAVKEKRLSLSEKNINDFTNIKLKVFPKLINLLQESSVFYKFSPEKGNTNWLYIDSFITENQRKEESIILGITEKGENTNNYAPSSILRGIPDEKGDYIGNVLIIACRNFSLKKEKYKAIYRVTDVSKIPDELKKDILDLENYNCITGNPIGNIKFKNFENRWIAKIDLERYGIEKKEIDIEGTQISAGFIEEERIYAGVMIYYNISDLIITKEIAQKFVPIKQKEQEKVIEKSKNKRIEIGD